MRYAVVRKLLTLNSVSTGHLSRSRRTIKVPFFTPFSSSNIRNYHSASANFASTTTNPSLLLIRTSLMCLPSSLFKKSSPFWFAKDKSSSELKLFMQTSLSDRIVYPYANDFPYKGVPIQNG